MEQETTGPVRADRVTETFTRRMAPPPRRAYPPPIVETDGVEVAS